MNLKIGKRIKALRNRDDVTQEKLAEAIGVTSQAISKWENGNGVPDTNVLPKLCKIFNVSVNEILNGERISHEDYKTKAEEELIVMKKQKEESDRCLLKIEIVLERFFISITITPSYKYPSVILDVILSSIHKKPFSTTI